MCEIISFGKKVLTEEGFVPPKNDWVKPIGGLWGSTYTPNQEYASDWQRWCMEERFGIDNEAAVIFTMKENAKVYEIDCREDLDYLAKRYNLKGSVFLTTLDFEKMAAAGYGAIHLTADGQEETRFSRPYSLYGWDAECWLILRFDAIATQRPYEPKEAAEWD